MATKQRSGSIIPRGKTIKKTKTPQPHKINAEGKGLLVHAIECPRCFDVIYSRARHDYRKCTCGEVAVDGGLDYLRVAFGKKEPVAKDVWVLVSIKDLYDDYNRKVDKYGLMPRVKV